ncbi:ABC transporter permease [Pasteurellaceae bacterium Pebbles2]|nr:ABC transporter permease [Pasteurellaceae bacterium Pebbles2]
MKLPFFSPHFRLIFLFFWGLFISTLQQPTLLIFLNMGLFFGLAWLIQSERKWRYYVKRWGILQLFNLFMWLTMSWRLGESGIEWNTQGIHTALLISLRMNALLFSVWLLLWKISDSLLVQALAKLPLPRKLISLLVLTVRYIALLGELQQKMDMAMRARGYQAKFNWRTMQYTSQQVALLLIKAMAKAEMAEYALKSRGFLADKEK